MSKSNPKNSGNRTWRDIPQQVNSRSMSRGGRRRMWGTAFRVTGAVITVALLIAAIVVFTDAFNQKPGKMSAAVNAASVDKIVLRTDGVLTEGWVSRTFALREGITLMELDIDGLRADLESHQQVSSATVRRRFPSTLEVSLAERAPIARISARDPQGKAQELLVARDGVVFTGVGFEREFRRTLPYLGGIKLLRDDGRLRPIKGMDTVSLLLATARNQAPHLYQGWKVVSLARLEDEQEIEVQSARVERIVFTTRSEDAFLKQIAQLDVLLDSVRAHTDQPVREINLSIGRMSDGRMQVPVTFSDTIPLETVVPQETSPNSHFFKTPRKTNREL